jgi:hypothetical protein
MTKDSTSARLHQSKAGYRFSDISHSIRQYIDILNSSDFARAGASAPPTYSPTN